MSSSNGGMRSALRGRSSGALPTPGIGKSSVRAGPPSRDGIRGRVGEQDDRRLEALGAVDGHDPDGIGRRRRVALDLDLAAVEPGEEAVERGRLGPLELERARQQFLDRVAGGLAEPAVELAAAVDGPERMVSRKRCGVV